MLYLIVMLLWRLGGEKLSPSKNKSLFTVCDLQEQARCARDWVTPLCCVSGFCFVPKMILQE